MNVHKLNSLHVSVIQIKQHNITTILEVFFHAPTTTATPTSILTPLINFAYFIQYEIIEFVFFCTWVLWLNMRLLCSSILLHIIVGFSFLVLYSSMWICNNWPILATLDGYLGILKWWFLKGDKGTQLPKCIFLHSPLYWRQFFTEIIP